MHDRFRRAIDDGELPADLDLDALISQLVGPLFYRRFISRQPLTPAFVRQLVRSALMPLVLPPASGVDDRRCDRRACGRGAPPRSSR